MPLPTFPGRSPQPEDSPSRFSVLQFNVRSFLAGSSVYSDSPAPSNHTTPKIPFRNFFRRPNSPPELPLTETPSLEESRDSTSSHSPLRPQHTAGSYQRAIQPDTDDNESTPTPPRPVHGRNASYVDPETQQLADLIHGRRPRRTKPRRPRYRRAWVRKRKERGTCCAFVRSKAARSKVIGCVISGIFLAVILSIYLCIALMRPKVGQEVHVLFILVILCTTIFFCHSLIRLCMLAYRPPDITPRIPDMTGPEGFRPIRPIPVRLARDEDVDEEDNDDESGEPKENRPVKQPPPAYGLWRCSVRVDPNLLHWQRADQVNPAHLSRIGITPSHSRSVSGSDVASGPDAPVEGGASGPRPPSYVSDDGVSYVVDAQARSIAPVHTVINPLEPTPSEGFPRVGLGLSEVHPLYR